MGETSAPGCEIQAVSCLQQECIESPIGRTTAYLANFYNTVAKYFQVELFIFLAVKWRYNFSTLPVLRGACIRILKYCHMTKNESHLAYYIYYFLKIALLQVPIRDFLAWPECDERCAA